MQKSSRRAVLTVVAGILLAGGGAAGCSSDSGSTSASTSSASSSTSSGASALCSSLSALQTSITDLQDVDVQRDGVTALQAPLAAVKTHAEQVIEDGKSHYGPQTDRLRDDLTTLQSAADTAVATPSASSVGAVLTAIGTFTTDVKALAKDVGSAC